MTDHGAAPPHQSWPTSTPRIEKGAADCPAGFSGVLQVGGYAGYKVLAERGNVQLAFCWRHVRRHFTNSPRPAHTAQQFELSTATLHAVNRHLETGSLSSRRLTDSFRA